MIESFFRPWSRANLRRRGALQGVGRDRAEEDAVGLSVAAELGQRRRRRGRRDLDDARRRRDRGQDRDRHRRDDAADDRRHLLHLDELGRHVDGDVALALRIARVGDELAAVAEAAGIVDVAEGHLDRLRAGLAIGPSRAGQLHDDADGDVAIGGLRGPGRGGEPDRGRHA